MQAQIVAGPQTIVAPPNSAGRVEISGFAPDNSANVFFRFSKFNTNQPDVRSVLFLNGLRTNAFVGVTDTTPSIINKTIALENTGNLFFLSPAGISVQAGAGFTNVATLLLTTSSRLKLGNAFFDVNSPDNPTASPAYTLNGILKDNLLEGSPEGAGFFTTSDAAQVGINIGTGSSISVDKGLLLVTNKTSINLESAALEAKGTSQKPVPGDGDGIAVITQNLNIQRAADSQLRPSMTSSSAIIIREPVATSDFAITSKPGVLLSTLYTDGATTADNPNLQDNLNGTLSNLKAANLDLFAGPNPDPTSQLQVLFQSYGLACTFQNNCSSSNAKITDADGKVVATSNILGRPAVESDFSQPDAGQRQLSVGLAIYSGIDFNDIRVFSGYQYNSASQQDFKTVSTKAAPLFSFEPTLYNGDVNVTNTGGRISALQFYILDQGLYDKTSIKLANAPYKTSAYFPNPPNPAADGSFRANFTNTSPPSPDPNDLFMYWFSQGPAGGNNTINVGTVGSLPLAPLPGPPNPPSPPTPQKPPTPTTPVDQTSFNAGALAASTIINRPTNPIPTYNFDAALLVVDQNVAEDYEASFAQSRSAKPALQVDLSGNPNGRRCKSSNAENCDANP